MTSILDSLGKTAFKLAFQISPILLVGGIANSIPGGILPIVALTEPVSFIGGLLAGDSSLETDSFFAHFEPLPGSTIINNQIARYPFANQSVAANAIISQPNNISMLMKCPSSKPGTYASRIITFTALESTLNNHTQKGGTFTILTPVFTFTPAVLLTLRDVTSGESKQVQSEWQFDFELPLITQEQAKQQQNNMMSKISNSVKTDGSTSGMENTVSTGSINPTGILSGAAAPSISVFRSPLQNLVNSSTPSTKEIVTLNV